jgi:hypothetical protein
LNGKKGRGVIPLPPTGFLKPGNKEHEAVGNIDSKYSLYENENIPVHTQRALSGRITPGGV